MRCGALCSLRLVHNRKRYKEVEMEKTVRMIGWLKWLSFFFGYIMYVFTKDSFGGIAAMLLSIAAAAAFWILISKMCIRDSLKVLQ